MSISLIASIFYGICWLALVMGVFLYKKSEKSLLGLKWIIIIYLTATCYQTLWAGVFDIVHIPINIVSIGFADAVAAIYFWVKIVRTKNIQKYEWKLVDAGAFFVMLAIVCCWVKIHCGGFALLVNYSTIDPVEHFKAAMDVVNNQVVNNMYYQALFNGLFIELLGPFANRDYFIKIFVLSDALNWMISGLMFFSIIRDRIKDRFSEIFGIGLMVIYAIGYPMCSIQYGFVYLGMGVTLVGMLIALTDSFANDEIQKWLGIMFLCLGCLGIFECYVLFMPAVFFAIITCVFIKQFKANKLVSVDTVIVCLAIFLIPCIFGMYFTYAGIFTSNNQTVGSAIAAEGAIYRDLFSNFLPFIPLMFFGFGKLIKRKDNNIILFLTSYMFIFICALFYKGMHAEVSSYYYYKNYFLMWLLILVLAFYGIVEIGKESRGIIVSIALTFCILLGVSLKGYEEDVQNRFVLFDPIAKAGSFMDIYNYNGATMFNPGYNTDKMGAYRWVYENLMSQGGEVAIASNWDDALWYQAITDQRFSEDWDFSGNDLDSYYDKLQSCGAEYVLVLNDSTLYMSDPEYYESMEKVYEANIGFVARIK